MESFINETFNNPTLFDTGILSCDTRISSIKDKIQSLSILCKVLHLAGLDSKDHDEKIKNYENNIKLIQVEKTIYTALSKSNNNDLFKKLLDKYDELLGISYDISGNMVNNGTITSDEFMEYYNGSSSQREYIFKLCYYGMKK